MDANNKSNKINASFNLMSALERIRANPRFIFMILAAAAISVVIALFFWARVMTPTY